MSSEGQLVAVFLNFEFNKRVPSWQRGGEINLRLAANSLGRRYESHDCLDVVQRRLSVNFGLHPLAYNLLSEVIRWIYGIIIIRTRCEHIQATNQGSGKGPR